MATLKDDLLVHIKAKYSILGIRTAEEQRVIRMITEIAGDPQTVNERTVYVGSITKGLLESNNEVSKGMSDPFKILMEIEKLQSEKDAKPSIFILLDYHPFMEAPPIRRKIRDLHTLLKGKRSTIVFISPVLEIHSDLQKVITVFDLPLPDKEELTDIFCTRIRGVQDQIRKLRDEKSSKPERSEAIQRQLDIQVPIVQKLVEQATENKDQIVSALQGLTSIEADNVVAKCIILKDISITTILSEKKQIVKKSGALDYWETDETQESIGGLKNLKNWSKSAKNRFSEKARKFGLTPPKGVLLMGVPGTGKTLSAKAMSNLFHIPMLTLNMAKMTSSLYGATGNKMVEAIKLAQAMAPAIVLIDEIDKAFGTSGHQQEHEESARTRGALLTAMEESTGIFWLATCNQPENLSPELAARFPVMFHVDLPTRKEREEIIAILLKKVGRDPAKYDISQLADISQGYVGRELRNAIQEGLGQAFDQGVELSEEHISAALSKITPTAIQREVDIGKIRAWSKRNAQSANEDETAPTKTSSAKTDNLNRELELV